MSFIKKYRTDATAENDGVWAIGQFRGELDLKIRSLQSRAAKDAQAAIDKRNRKFWQLGQEVPADVKAQNECELACAIVVAWRGADAVDEDGAPMPCTDDTKAQVFGDPELWELRQQVIGYANNADNYRKASLKAAAGNSAPRSVAGSATADAATTQAN